MSSQYGSTAKGTSLENLREQVQQQLRQELGDNQTSTYSSEYEQFKKENRPVQHSIYERAAIAAGKLVGFSPGKAEAEIQKNLETAHLICTPKDAVSLSVLAPFAAFFVTVMLTVFVPFAFTQNLSPFYLIFSIVIAAMVYFPLKTMPKFLAQNWRQRASNQMVLAIFYMVTYMRHTPNLELAVEFAANHIGPPLSLDLKKVMWDVETQKFQTVTESMENYLVQWRDSNREFVESVHLVQSSLYETSNERRINSLDKALEVMLDETYEKMLHYAQNLKSPITMLHMLGIILPVLGLVILPLGVSFFDTHWTVIASLYNVILPFSVFYLGKRILSTRPTGYGESNLAELNPEYQKTKQGLSPTIEAGLIAGVLLFIGISPLLIHLFFPSFDIVIGSFKLLDYVSVEGVIRGPFGLGAGVLSIFVTLSAGLGAGYYYKRRSKGLIKIRNRTKKLETEFASALFQLGNRIGDGIPMEIAFGKVATTMEGTTAGEFYRSVALNIQKLGMGVEEAIFNEKHGALINYPSSMIESSMKVLTESAKKGPQEASKALMSMSNYIKEMHRVDERLKDLLADVLSSMKSQINFLLPTIAGIVIGITSMITTVLGAIQEQAAQFQGEGPAGGIPVDLFGVGIPTYYFQLIVGIYVVQITWILASLISGIENGTDPLSEHWLKGKAMTMATILYSGIGLVIILIFNLIAGQIITSIA